MSGGSEEKVGQLIQSYLDATWGDFPDRTAVENLRGLIGRELCERIDVLGFESEQLLDVPAKAVLSVLDKLESAAIREDREAAAVARSTRLQKGVTRKTRTDGISASKTKRRVPQRFPGRRLRRR